MLRKSKPDLIKFLLLPLALVLAAGAAAAVGPGTGVVRVTSDPTGGAGQHATLVEPDAASNGSTIVTTFQAGRFSDGGGEAIGFARSTDGGRSWRSGLLPALTSASTPPGPFTRASDPVVVWDALHARWLAATLPLGPASTGIAVSSSPDGLTWGAPVFAASAARLQNGDTNFDKEWLGCDNGRSSPFFGHCYLAYTDFTLGGLAVQSTSDGGVTFTPPVAIPVRTDVPGPQIAVRRSGELVIVFLESQTVKSIRSSDGGATFSSREDIARLIVRNHPFRRDSLRVFPLPSADADAAGRVYVVWFDCRFRRSCQADDLVLSTSAGGGRWTRPVRVKVPRTGSTDFVLPALGVNPNARGRLALTYYTLNAPSCSLASCRLDAWFTTSKNGGARWATPRRLNAQRMRLAWLAETGSGRMVGDYFGSVYAGGRAVGIATIARPPSSGRLDEAIYAVR